MKNDYYNQMWAGVQDELRRQHYTGRVFSNNKLAGAVSNEEELRAKLGRRWREQLANLAGLCGAVHHLTAPLTELCEFPISGKSNGMLARFGSWQNGSKVLKLAREVGLVVCTNEYFSSGAGVAKCYIFNKDVEKLLLAIANKERIKPKMPVNYKKKQSSINSLSPIPNPITLSPNGATIQDAAGAEGLITSLSHSSNLLSLSPNGATIQDAPDHSKTTTSSSLLSSLSPNSATIQKRVHIGRLMLRGATMAEVEDALLLNYPQIPYL